MSVLRDILAHHAQKIIDKSSFGQSASDYRDSYHGHQVAQQGYPKAYPPEEQHQFVGHYLPPTSGHSQLQHAYPRTQSASQHPQLSHAASPLQVTIARESSSKTFTISDTSTNQPIFLITPATPHNHDVLNMCRPNGQLLATIKFGYNVSFTMYEGGGGGEGKLKRSEWIDDKWSWRTVNFGGEKWTWKIKDHMMGELKAEKGNVVARIEVMGERSVLSLERVGLSTSGIDEVLVTGFAVWEKSRRDKSEVEELEAVVEVLTGMG